MDGTSGSNEKVTTRSERENESESGEKKMGAKEENKKTSANQKRLFFDQLFWRKRALLTKRPFWSDAKSLF